MMFKKIDVEDYITGTCYQGIVATSYNALVQVFGEPNCSGDGYKTHCEWHLMFDNGTVATLYDWKEDFFEESKVIDWHIGGRNKDAVEAIVNALK